LYLSHLRIIIELLRANKLIVKKSKCSFGATQIEYLGHIISSKGVATDPKKIEAMLTWHAPVTVKQLRGFLRVIGYYRKFIKGYGAINNPLTEVLKKDSFHWNPAAKKLFQRLKQAMVSALVLALPNLEKESSIETDASRIGI